MKYSDICKPLYKERGNVFARILDDNIESIHKEGGGKKEEGGSKGDDSGDGNAGEREERKGVASLEDAFDNDKIYGTIASVQGTTFNNTRDNAKDDDDEEGRMVGITQFWVCAMGHMEAVAELIMERDIDCLNHLTDVHC